MRHQTTPTLQTGELVTWIAIGGTRGFGWLSRRTSFGQYQALPSVKVFDTTTGPWAIYDYSAWRVRLVGEHEGEG